MKRLSIILLLIVGVLTTVFSQTKVWDRDLKVTKTKGIYTKLESPTFEQVPKKNQDSIAIIGGATVAGILIPYVIKYGNYLLKKATSKNEVDYQFKSTCLNQKYLTFTSLKDSVAKIKVTQVFFHKGSSNPKNLANYSFRFEKKGSSLGVELVEVSEDYIPVKMKKKYDLLISNFDISVSALVTEEIDSVTYQRKIIDLGTTTIYKVDPSFKLDKSEIINAGGLLLPSVTDKGKDIIIEQLIVKVVIKHINPYGTTSSGLNDFLEKNSETNEAFLNSIFIKNEE
ncbi:MAG: hypothetical protein QM503_03050 [Bacteroidota bacterium]